MRWYPPNQKIENVFDRLARYPVVKVDPKVAQNISRCKKIRYLSRRNKIHIKKGIISLPEETKIFKMKNGFDFKF